MRYVRKLNLNMSFLLVTAVTALLGCSADVSQTVQPSGRVARVSVTLDSSTLLLGHSSRASAIAKDSAGNPVDATSGISWKSLNETVATVSTSGYVTAVGPGVTEIQATLSGKTDAVTLMVADLASHDFDDGGPGAYTYAYTNFPNDLDFPDDPTGSGRGKVARLHYIRAATTASADVDRSFDFAYNRKIGESLYFRGEFYIPVADITANGIQRKLFYAKPHTDYAKYGWNSAGNTGFASVVNSFGSHLYVNIKRQLVNGTYDRIDLDTGAILQGNRWYTLEVQQTMESSPAASDGIFRVWLDGVLAYEKTNFKWIDPAWNGVPLPNGNGTPYDIADAYFDHYNVGDQVNWSGLYNEYRYWDNVAFSTRRIGK